MDERTNLLSLGEDILYIILTQLQNNSLASLLKFANASKECEKLAGPILYRSLTLSDKGDEGTLKRTKKLFKRLLAKDDPIHNYIKELKIADWGDKIDHSRPGIPITQARADPDSLNVPWDSCKIRNGDSQLLPSSELECALENLTSLESFSWDANTRIPGGVISKLEEYRPNARLSVNNNRRNEETSDVDMDIRLLSSPLLYSLNYSIFYSTTSSGIVCSEFQTLKDILVQSQKLRTLSLAVYVNSKRGIAIPKAPVNWHPYLPVGSGDPLLKLHTLTIPDKNTFYAQQLGKVHSAMFTQANDFTQLNRLALRNLCGYHSFGPLKGRVPNLKHLEFSFRIEDSSHRAIGDRCKNPVLVRDFLDSISALETLEITNHQDNFNILWPAIVRHLSSLRRLGLHTPPDQTYKSDVPPTLTCNRLEQLQESKIWDLAIDVTISDIAWFSKSDRGLNKLDLDPSVALSLANFTDLERFKIYVELPPSESVFSEIYNYDPVRERVPLPPLIEKKAREVALGLYEQISMYDPRAALRELEICFCRLDIGDRMQSNIVHNSLWVRKTQIDYINKPQSEGYEVEFQGKWERQGRE